VILYNAWKQLRPAVRELTDIAPDASMESQVRTIAGRVPGILRFGQVLRSQNGIQFLRGPSHCCQGGDDRA